MRHYVAVCRNGLDKRINEMQQRMVCEKARRNEDPSLVVLDS